MAQGGNLTLRDRLGWTGLFSWFNNGKKPTGLFRGQDRQFNAAESAGTSSSSGKPVNVQTALQVSAVFAAVRIIAGGVAQVEKQVVVREYDSQRQRFTHRPIPDDRLWRLLCERPNDFQTPFEFWECMVMLAALCGNSYAFVNAPSGLPLEIIPLMNDQITVVQKDDNTLAYRVKVSGGDTLDLTQRQVLHLRGPSLGGPLGLDVLETAREVIGISQSAEHAHSEIMNRRGRFDGIVSADTDLAETTIKSIREQFVSRFGPGGNGGVAFLDRAAKFSPITQTSTDLQLIEHRRHAIDEVGRAFGVFSQLLNQHSANSAYASVEQVFLAHLTHTLEPWLVRVEQAVKRDVIGFGGTADKKQFVCSRESLIRGTVRDMAEYLKTMILMGVLTPNEARVMIGRNPLEEPGADRPMTQLNMRVGFEPTLAETQSVPAETPNQTSEPDDE
jgi:HK97 family phage portal protein